MNKLIGLLLLILTFNGLIMATPTAKSTQFADSYLMRVQGCEALYWNPAMLTNDFFDVLIPGMNQTFYITNNSFDLSDYNWLSGRYLSERDKRKLLNMIDGHLTIEGEYHTSIFGITFGNMAVATGFHSMGNINLSEKYLQVLLYGNEQDSYVFTRKHNQFNMLVYQDATLGVGDIKLNELVGLTDIPTVKLGAAGSLLLGYGVIQTTAYNGYLNTSIDGLSMLHNVQLKSGTGGIGGKVLFSLASEPIPNIHVGLSLDNLFGNIHWYSKTEKRGFTVSADSIFAAHLDEDMFAQSDTVFSIDDFVTVLPVEIRIGGLYRMNQMSFSMDWVQGVDKSHLTSPIGRISIGTEFLPIKQLHLRTGLALGNRDYPWRMSYGGGLKIKGFEIGIGIQTIMSIIPGYQSKGISFSTYVDIPL